MLGNLKRRLRNWATHIAESSCRTAVADQAKYSPALRAQLAHLSAYYSVLRAQGGPYPRLQETGFRVYSEYEEDGMLLYIFSLIGTANRTFVDIGAGDAIMSNCANLAINLGWHGLLVDGSEGRIKTGREYYATLPDCRAYPPKFVQAILTRANVNAVIRENGVEGEIDFLSLDIDGNDYWILDAIDCISPRIMLLECHVEFGKHNIVVPYDEKYMPSKSNPYYRGAGPAAMVALAKQRGYRLIGGIRLGFNLFFARNDISAEMLPEVSLDEALAHPRNAEQFKHFAAIKDKPYVLGGTPFPGQPARLT